ncbi:hypothetical protein ACERK3_13710 [Phycisphaerales bacterium AB-hyl4]|uniref:Uncharacterized protein n=1 Tax=Natronomicrosphaera hydrolytica TaxID=3242702 RepID=A0ABV4U6W6_9BACT
MLIGLVIAIPVVMIAASAIHWFALGGSDACLHQKQQYLLNHADHDRILRECRLMLGNPAQYPQPSGRAYPDNLPLYLDSLESSSILVFSEGVLITFHREFGLWAIEQDTSQVPSEIDWRHNVTELRPGLWYFEFHVP